MRGKMNWIAVVAAGLLLGAAWADTVRAGDYKVSVYDAARVFPGTTLLCDMSQVKWPRIVEVDFSGKVVWQHRLRVERGDRSALLDASLLDNGNILFTMTNRGIYEIDRLGRVVWKHEDGGASHDADRLPNGNTLYNRAWQPKGSPVVVEVDREGRTVWSWYGVEAFDRPPFAGVDFEGWMHVNSVTRLANGNTLISIRNFNTIVEVDPSGRVVWHITFRGHDRRVGLSTEGRIVGVLNHEPEPLDNGHILLALRQPNRYVEIDRATGAEVWSWSHPEGERALLLNREANRLPNGNTLGSAGDKLIEIAPDGTIVWQIHAPAGDQNERKFHKAIRIAPDGRTAYGG
ncbi:MAG: aryl-sulfate sulfotransferase [Deltaproteobacteria bacterium]|nr:aryl-sulfate sulfotransferase [Deltaproteobacteria bacterium]